MKREKLFLFVLIFGLIFTMSFAMASNCPPVGPPKIYSGNIYVNGAPLIGTYTLNAIMGMDRVGEIQVSGGKYSNLQISPCSGVTGDIIFAIHGVQTNEMGYYYGSQDEWGENVSLTLNLNKQPPIQSTCGDSAIQIGEECDGANLAGRTSCGTGYEGTISCSSTCEIDYSQCKLIQQNTNPPASPGSDGSSGGGGGGGSGGSKRTVSSNSTDSAKTDSSISDLSNLDIKTTVDTNGEESNKRPGFFRFTGNAIEGVGDFATSGMGVAIEILILLVLLYFIIIKNKLAKKGRGKKSLNGKLNNFKV